MHNCCQDSVVDSKLCFGLNVRATSVGVGAYPKGSWLGTVAGFKLLWVHGCEADSIKRAIAKDSVCWWLGQVVWGLQYCDPLVLPAVLAAHVVDELLFRDTCLESLIFFSLGRAIILSRVRDACLSSRDRRAWPVLTLELFILIVQ